MIKITNYADRLIKDLDLVDYFDKEALVKNIGDCSESVYLKIKTLEKNQPKVNNLAMFNGGASYADAISFGDDQIDKKLIESFSKVKGKKVITYQPDSDLTEYLQLYSDLANK